MRKKTRRCGSLCLAAVMAAMLAAPVQAASLSDYDEATRTRLQDQVLEYDEIPALVSLYNPDMQQAYVRMEDSLSVYRNGMTEYKNRAAELDREADKASENGDMAESMVYKTNEAAMRSMAKEYKKAVERAESVSSTRSLMQAEDTITMYVQQMVQGYAQMESGCRIGEKSVELAQAAYDSAVVQSGLGMASAGDVKAAENSLQTAQAGLRAAEEGKNAMKQNICMMTGWDYQADMTIAGVPELDLGQIESVNLQADTEKAINNNYELISIRQGKANTTVTKNVRERNLSEKEQEIRISMTSLYETLRQKLSEKEGADAAWAAAQKEREALDRKQQLGMVGRLEYLQGELAYLQAESAKQAADLELRKAYEEYEWQVTGISVSGTAGEQ